MHGLGACDPSLREAATRVARRKPQRNSRSRERDRPKEAAVLVACALGNAVDRSSCGNDDLREADRARRQPATQPDQENHGRDDDRADGREVTNFLEDDQRPGSCHFFAHTRRRPTVLRQWQQPEVRQRPCAGEGQPDCARLHGALPRGTAPGGRSTRVSPRKHPHFG